MRRRMMEAAYRRLCGPFEAPTARKYHVDHQLGEMQAGGEWNVYAPTGWLVGQRAGLSDVKDPPARTRESWFITLVKPREAVPC